LARERLDDLAWQRSSFCNIGECLEVADLGELVAVRSSKNPDGTILTFPAGIWQDFIDEVKSGDLG
jgi:hypothetical protein